MQNGTLVRLRPAGALVIRPMGRPATGIEWRVELTHQEIFERYVYAGAITRNADAIAEMFTEDGVFDAPLVDEGHPLRHRLVGRDAIRAGIARYHLLPTQAGTINVDRTAYVLHDTADPDVFIAEIDVALDHPDGRTTTMSLVQIFRLRDGRIAMLRDYFAEPPPPAR
jgi:ketosteroid isomerase-like protein